MLKRVFYLFFPSYIFLSCIGMVLSNACSAQSRIKSPEEKKILKEANQIFQKGLFDNALPSFLELYKIDSTNANYNFSIGICYLMGVSEKTNAIKHLEKAAVDSSSELHNYINYFLGEAYKSVGNCDESKKYFEKYKTTLTDTSRLNKEVDNIIQLCNTNKPSSDTLVKSISPVVNVPGVIDSLVKNQDKEVTILVEDTRVSAPDSTYHAPADTLVNTSDIIAAPTLAGNDSTVKASEPVKAIEAVKEVPMKKPVVKEKNYPAAKLPDSFYSVQVGGFTKPVPDGYFKDLKKLYQYETGDKTKYFSGIFPTKDQAKVSLEEIRKTGFGDAFIVYVVSGMKLTPYEAEAKSSSDASNKKDLLYTVQIGAFKGSVPVNMAVQFVNVDELKIEKSADGYTRYFVGSYTEKQKAEDKKRIMIDKGFKSAFITELQVKSDK